MEIINIPDISLSAVEIPEWFLEKSAAEQVEAVQADRIADEKLLHKLAKTHDEADVACVAVEKLASAKSDYSVIALADIALHGKNAFARPNAAGSLPAKGFIHAPFIQEGSLPCQGLIYAVSIQADEEPVREIAAKRLQRGTATAYEAPLRKSILDPRLFELLYLLDPEEDLDYIAYLARTAKGGARGKMIARLLPPEHLPKPEDEEPGNDVVYWLTRKLMFRENDTEALANAVFSVNSDLISRMAFSRLTGWRHYEPCDSYSHRTYECGRVEGVTEERLVALCQRVVRSADRLLIEAAKAILKRLVSDTCAICGEAAAKNYINGDVAFDAEISGCPSLHVEADETVALCETHFMLVEHAAGPSK